MKAMISLTGLLLIERAGVWKEQHCINLKETRCGDHCPLFLEKEDWDSESDNSVFRVVSIAMACGWRLEHEVEGDNRISPNKIEKEE